MTAQGANWEGRMLAWAAEALNGATAHPTAVPGADLDEAYAVCADITREHSKTFYLATALLPRDKRRAMRALYAFCRVTDNLVDDVGRTDREAALASWRDQVLGGHTPTSDPVALAWADTSARYRIPHGYARQLIDGVTSDLHRTRYETFDDLADYAYAVASTVGLMAMHIIGFDGHDALPDAVKLGVALQATNILRDVAEDWSRGRIYLPHAELIAFGLSEVDVAAGRNSEKWRAFMRYQMARIRQLYAESRPGIARLDRSGRFAVAAAARLYEGILDDIEAHDYDVFSRRAHLSAWAKLIRLPGIWWLARRPTRQAR
ncbi:MAG: squalene/phytoene synthase family protein [Anaerolineae bacterium]|nr:squalene/phytoene synthase family protein [Anaerolineae bacterium]